MAASVVACIYVTGLIGLHEFVLVTRTLRPIAVAAYASLVSILLGIELGDLTWGIGGLFVALLLAFVLKGLGDTRGSATVSVGTTRTTRRCGACSRAPISAT